MRRGLRVNFPGMVVLGTLFKCCWAHNDAHYHYLAGFQYQACTVSSEWDEKYGYCRAGYLYYSPSCSGGRWTINVGNTPHDSEDSGCGNVAVSPVTTSVMPRAGGWTVFCDGGDTTMTISGTDMATSDPPPCPNPKPFYSSVTFGDWVSNSQNGCGGQDYRALIESSLACSAPAGCDCAMDSAITLYDYNGQYVQLRDQAACTTTSEPCPSNVAYTYTWGDWYSTTGTACGGEDRQDQTERCSAPLGCSCTNRYTPQSDTRQQPPCTTTAPPCPVTAYEYELQAWVAANPGVTCGGQDRAEEKQVCNAPQGCACTTNQRAPVHTSRDQPPCTTTAPPCPATAYEYELQAWFPANPGVTCGGQDRAEEKQVCNAPQGCACSTNQRAPVYTSRGQPSCDTPCPTTSFTYSWGPGVDATAGITCGGQRMREEVEACAAAEECTCTTGQRAVNVEYKAQRACANNAPGTGTGTNPGNDNSSSSSTDDDSAGVGTTHAGQAPERNNGNSNNQSPPTPSADNADNDSATANNEPSADDDEPAPDASSSRMSTQSVVLLVIGLLSVIVIAGLVALYMRASSKQGQQGQQGQQQQQQPSVSEFGSTYEVGNFNGKGRAGHTANRVTPPTFEVPGAAVAAAAQSAPPATGAGGTTNYATYAPQPSEARGGGAGAEGASSGSSNVVYATYAGDSDGAGTAGAGAGSAPLKASSAHSYSTYAPPPGSPSSTRTRTSTSNNRGRSGTNRGNRGNNESAYNVLAPRTNEDSQTYSVAVHNTSRRKAASASASAAPSSTTYDRLGQNQKWVSSSGRSGGGGSTSNGNGNNYDALGTHPSRSNAATTGKGANRGPSATTSWDGYEMQNTGYSSVATTGKGANRGPSATTSWDGYEMQNTGYSSVSPGQAAGRDATAPRLRSATARLQPQQKQQQKPMKEQKQKPGKRTGDKHRSSSGSYGFEGGTGGIGARGGKHNSSGAYGFIEEAEV
eukprot:gene1758-6658_t